MLKTNDTPNSDIDIDIEERFVSFAITNSKELTIFLVNGIKLEGNIIACLLYTSPSPRDS